MISKCEIMVQTTMERISVEAQCQGLEDPYAYGGDGAGILSCQCLARACEVLFPTLEELNIGLVAFSPMANGFLTGKYSDASTFTKDGSDYRVVMPQFAEGAAEKNRELFALLDSVADDHGETSAQISLAWMTCKKP